MEKAILKTLIYANIFAYPLKGYEVYKWLVKKPTTLLQVEAGLNRLIKKRKVEFFKGYYFLSKEKSIVLKRIRREKYSKTLYKKAILFAQILKIIPWIKLVGISGGLALNDADKKDDVDLFIITAGSRLWLSRLLAILILDLFRIRRKAGMSRKDTKGKVCLNTVIDEGFLEQKFKDLFIAHEVLQMKVIWQREGIYSRYLNDNDWAFNFLPNWTSRIKYLKARLDEGSNFFNIVERLAKKLQIKIMQKPNGLERIEEGGLYFYPNDYRAQILKLYNQRTKRFSSTT